VKRGGVSSSDRRVAPRYKTARIHQGKGRTLAGAGGKRVEEFEGSTTVSYTAVLDYRQGEEGVGLWNGSTKY